MYNVELMEHTFGLTFISFLGTFSIYGRIQIICVFNFWEFSILMRIRLFAFLLYGHIQFLDVLNFKA